MPENLIGDCFKSVPVRLIMYVQAFVNELSIRNTTLIRPKNFTP